MLDSSGAAKAMTATSTNLMLMSLGVNPEATYLKSSWDTMIQGTWALLYKWIHNEFPSRDEVSAALTSLAADTTLKVTGIIADYTSKSINPSLLSASKGSYSPATPVICGKPGFTLPFIPKLILLPVVGRSCLLPETDPLTAGLESAANIEIGLPQMELITAFALSPATAILGM